MRPIPPRRSAAAIEPDRLGPTPRQAAETVSPARALKPDVDQAVETTARSAAPINRISCKRSAGEIGLPTNPSMPAAMYSAR